jgi:primase-polymerase (primpol)-like protein
MVTDDPPTAQTVPSRLHERDQWVCWRTEQRDGEATKLPVEPVTGGFASTTDPDTWREFGVARGYAAARDTDVDGVGFVFTEADSLVGVDLDDCRDPATGELDEPAATIVEDLDSYTEVSPSGTGVHVLLEGELPEGRNRRGTIELYDEARYFTVTGAHLTGTPRSVEARQEALTAVHAEHVGRQAGTEADGQGTSRADVNAAQADAAAEATTDVPSPGGVDANANANGDGAGSGPAALSDEELLDRAMSAANGEKFRRLWNGRTTGYDSHSEADMALCVLLAFWTGGDRGRIDRLFRESGLMREKWDEIHYADGRTYGEGTIERALEVTDERYEPQTDGRTETETGGPERSEGAATERAVENPEDPDVDGVRGRSRAHLVERNRLLRRRVEEQAARIEALKAALERQSKDMPDKHPSERRTSDVTTDSVGVRERLGEWIDRMH